MRLKIIFLLPVFCLCSVIGRGQVAWDLTSTMTAILTDKGVLTVRTTKSAEAMPNFSVSAYSSSVPWYNLRAGIFSVVIESGISSIGNNVFRDCGNLTSIAIPNTVTTIGDYAFYNCSVLTFLTLPNSITTIGGSAFYNCRSLVSVTIPNAVTTIGDDAFRGCIGLSSVTIGNSVKTIGASAFSGCSRLHSVAIPNSVTTIGGGAFGNCTGLTSVTIPNAVTSIGTSAFQNCKGLKDVTVQWNMPLAVPNDVFRDVTTSNVTLHVPAGTEFFYQTAAVWMFFIVTSNPVGVENVVLPPLKANAANGIMHLTGLRPGEQVSIYTLTGHLIYQGIAKAEEAYVPIGGHGVCIAVAGKRSVKVFAD